MITVQPADTPQEESPSLAMPSETAKARMPMVWIPATLCVGLLIAAIYLGGRIVTANRHASAASRTPAVVQAVVQPKPTPVAIAPAPATPVPAVEVKTEPKPEAAPKTAKPDAAPLDLAEVPMITPKAGERYIQVGALDLEATRRYLGKLRQSKLEPHVAPGPQPKLLRVLIGPFADHDSLIATKNDLESAGIENFVRQY
jgi:cell division septation protein DedD